MIWVGVKRGCPVGEYMNGRLGAEVGSVARGRHKGLLSGRRDAPGNVSQPMCDKCAQDMTDIVLQRCGVGIVGVFEPLIAPCQHVDQHPLQAICIVVEVGQCPGHGVAFRGVVFQEVEGIARRLFVVRRGVVGDGGLGAKT